MTNWVSILLRLGIRLIEWATRRKKQPVIIEPEQTDKEEDNDGN